MDHGRVPARVAMLREEAADYPYWEEAFYLHYLKGLSPSDFRRVYLTLVCGPNWDDTTILKGTQAVHHRIRLICQSP